MFAALLDTFVYCLPYAGVVFGDTTIQILSMAGVAAYLVVQAFLLTSRGQSVGKIAWGLRIVRIEDNLPYRFSFAVASRFFGTGPWVEGFVANVLLRAWLNGLLAFISSVIVMLPVILLGGPSVVLPVYALVDALFIFREDRRCLHDFLAGTRVVMTRAKVGGDDEFEDEEVA
ncbi:MAG: RDD family protein [Elusimicrobia bacterium]|nr:RDD family protein [Elusimicrobiota bacterium]